MLLNLIRHLSKTGRRASVSVEFAVISSFFLVPLLLGSADFVVLLTARAQLNVALQALYYTAWTNPTGAYSTGSGSNAANIIAAINSSSVYKITLPTTLSTGFAGVAAAQGSTNGIKTYGCFSNPTAPSSANPVTSSTTVTYQASACDSGVTTINAVTYEVDTTVVLPVPLPGVSTTLKATGATQILSLSSSSTS